MREYIFTFDCVNCQNREMQSYLTMYNGERPFRVDVLDKTVNVYESRVSMDDEENENYEFFKSWNNVERVFIGKNEDEAEFDGNSILLQLPDNNYVFIADLVLEFKTDSKIVKFVSIVGDNQVSYPYAIDELERVFLFTEQVRISNVPVEYRGKDPYLYFYDMVTETTPLTLKEDEKYDCVEEEKKAALFEELNEKWVKSLDERYGKKHPCKLFSL